LPCGQYTGGAAPESACHGFATIDRRGATFALRRAHLALLKWRRISQTGAPHESRERAMKAVIDFSYAALVAAVIGIAVGGTAFSFVWLLHILKV
jgi:hypothetical protein